MPVVMNKSIPTYELNTIARGGETGSDVLFLGERSGHSTIDLSIPYRSNYYKIGICLKGHAQLKANLEAYDVTANYLMIMSPNIIKQWPAISGDFNALSIFFTGSFISSGNTISPDKFPFFESYANHAFKLSLKESEEITASLLLLQQKYEAPHPYRNEILKSHITSLLFEIAAIYDRHTLVSSAFQTRAQHLAVDFKKLVLSHASKERALRFYAEKLCITSKHLTETVKEVTGKTAGELITEAVILEAKVLLQNPAFNIARVSELLNFPDQASFSRFFKKNSGLSPIAYRQAA